MAPSSSHQPERQFTPLAAVLAWIWPGLEHVSLGQRKRGLLIMVGILFLVVSGLLIGGLDCVDRKNDKLWFLAQGLNGPIAFAADYLNQRLVQSVPEDWSGRSDLAERYFGNDPELLESLRRIGVGRVNEMGTLFVALAGLMNLVVILDALYAMPRVADEERRDTP